MAAGRYVMYSLLQSHQHVHLYTYDRRRELYNIAESISTFFILFRLKMKNFWFIVRYLPVYLPQWQIHAHDERIHIFRFGLSERGIFFFFLSFALRLN